MSVAKKIRSSIEKASWIRKMFEEGAMRKERYGPGNVFDFSLGNPNLEPPEKVKTVLKELVSSDARGMHGYMPNAGFVETRRAVAGYLSSHHNLTFDHEDVVMTAGAGGGMNVVLKALLNAGDEVVVPAPYFMEYATYIDNYNGNTVEVPTNQDFSLDHNAIEKSLGPRTKAIIINNPNNPTGKVYKEAELRQLGELLTYYGSKKGEPIYLISDEPYSKIIFNGMTCPSIFGVYPHTFLVTSFSKDLSLPGERIGYVAVHPSIEEKNMVRAALVLCNRILGFVNAPALMQRMIPFLLEDSVDAMLYQRKRDILCRGLEEGGYTFTMPEGTFYVFPKTPIPDDVEFVGSLREENILTVPGSGFGCPGHFRIAFCTDDKTIQNSLPGFARVMKKYT